MRIARQFHWEMGHRLPFHSGGCANIHGHSYKLWVEIDGPCDRNGMLMDYGDMKGIVQPILDRFDHAFICHEEDSTVRDFLDLMKLKTVIVPFHTTAENLVLHLLDLVWEAFSAFPQVSQLKLRLQETDISYAEASRFRDER
jgi:6-pyruvoyltetrahydropterin/6-carboxytetrahydropterin synthase